jgi:hypothetical protein
MASGGGFILFTVGALCLGFAVGKSADPQPEVKTQVKIVKVPTVKTHVEYRDRYEPMPESCTEAIATLTEVGQNNSAMTGAAGTILDALGDLGLSSAQPGIHDVNEVTERIMAAKDKLDSASIREQETARLVTAKVTACQKEVAEGP